MANLRAKTTLSRAELDSIVNGPPVEKMAQGNHRSLTLEAALARAPAAQDTGATNEADNTEIMRMNEVHRLNDIAHHPQRLRGHTVEAARNAGSRNVFMGGVSIVDIVTKDGEPQVDQDGDVCMLDSEPILFDEFDIPRQSSSKEKQDDLALFNFGSMGVPDLDGPEFEDVDGDFDSDFDESDDEKIVVDLTTEEDVSNLRVVEDLTTNTNESSQIDDEVRLQSVAALPSAKRDTSPRVNANVQPRRQTMSQQAQANHQARLAAQCQRQQSNLRITTGAEPTPAPSSQGHASTDNPPFLVSGRLIPGVQMPAPRAGPASTRDRRTTAAQQPQGQARTQEQRPDHDQAPFSVFDRGLWRTTTPAQQTVPHFARTQPRPANTWRQAPIAFQPRNTADGRLVYSPFDRTIPQARRLAQSQQLHDQPSAAPTSSQQSMQQQGPNNHRASGQFEVPESLRRLQPSTEAGSSGRNPTAHPNANR